MKGQLPKTSLIPPNRYKNRKNNIPAHQKSGYEQTQRMRLTKYFAKRTSFTQLSIFSILVLLKPFSQHLTSMGAVIKNVNLVSKVRVLHNFSQSQSPMIL